MSREPDYSRRGKAGMMTSFVFRVRNIPAALYKAMGGFATNGVNMTKLESYMVDGSFTATQFYADIEGHPDDRNVQLALEELDYFTATSRFSASIRPTRAAARAPRQARPRSSARRRWSRASSAGRAKRQRLHHQASAKARRLQVELRAISRVSPSSRGLEPHLAGPADPAGRRRGRS